MIEPHASGLITSSHIERDKVGTVTDFIFLGSRITVDGDCSHEIKRCLLLGGKAMTNLDKHIKKQTSLPYRLLQNIEYISLCYTVGPYWLSILYIVVCLYVSPKCLIYPSLSLQDP